MDIDERVRKAKKDEREFEALLNDYRPFIASSASRTVCKYVGEHDDEMSIAMIAFAEAVQRYRPQGGKFLPYAKQVIRSRLIDHERSRNREPKTVSTDLIATQLQDMAEGRVAIFDSEFEDPLKLEIDSLSAALNIYGISFMDIAKCSPKHAGTKRDCAKIVRCILEHPEYQRQLKQSRQIPASGIRKITGVPRKRIERHRKYIVCLVEILTGEYAYLSEYVKFIRED